MEHIFQRIWGVLFKTDKAWGEIALKPNTIPALVMFIVLPLLIISTILDKGLFAVDTEATGLSWVIIVIISICSSLISFFAGAWMIHLLGPRYKSESTYLLAFNLVIFSYLPILISKIISLTHPRLALLIWVGIYSIYLFWKGTVTVLKTPETHATGFTIISLMIVIGLDYVISSVALAIVSTVMLN